MRRRWQWWLWYLRERRKQRLFRAGGSLVPDTLLNGLVEFYQPVSGVQRIVSWNESAAAPASFAAAAANVMNDPGGSYGDATLSYRYVPYRLEGGQKKILGIGRGNDVVFTSATNNAVVLPAPVVSGGNVDGVYVVRYDHGLAEFHYREVALNAFPLLDLGMLWTPGLWFDFSSLPSTQHILWAKQPYESSNTVPIDTTLSPLGGWSFDSIAGQELISFCRADLVAMPQVTIAFWVSLSDTGGPACCAAVRGISSAARVNLLCNAEEATNSIQFSMSDAVASYSDHAAGDWYLVTASVDDTSADGWVTRVTTKRLRDGAEQMSMGIESEGGFFAAANEESDLRDALLSGLLAIGSSGHWAVKAPGLFDRIALWNRVLTEDEIERLYGVGLGWSPAG